MATAFANHEVIAIIRRVQRLVAEVEHRPESYRPADWDRLHARIFEYVTKQTSNQYDNFVENVLEESYHVVVPPTIFPAMRDRAIDQWRQTLARAFGTAKDAIQPNHRTIMQRVSSFLASMFGMQAPEEPKEVKVKGFVRARRNMSSSWSMNLVSYLRLLFRTIPRNLERDLMSIAIRLFQEEELFRISGGVSRNSAATCAWCNGKVLTKDALDFVTKSTQLKDRLFHPNCAHAIHPVPGEYQGSIQTERDAHRALRGNMR